MTVTQTNRVLHRTVPYRTFRPLGGSLVILTPFCKIDTGNSLQGIDVSHNRKSLCTVSGLSSSHTRSSSANHEIYKWQFCRYTYHAV